LQKIKDEEDLDLLEEDKSEKGQLKYE